MMLYLKSANREDIGKEWLFQRDIPADENSFINDYYNISREDFDKAIDVIIAQSEGKQLPEGYVPQTVYYLWDDDKIVGTFHLRHYLCHHRHHPCLHHRSLQSPYPQERLRKVRCIL